MKFYNLIIILIAPVILLFACSGTPTAKYNTSVDFNQEYLGNDGGVLYYTVTIENQNALSVFGQVLLTVYCYDGSSYEERVDFKAVPPLAKYEQEGKKHVDGKRVTRIDIKDDEFYYR